MGFDYYQGYFFQKPKIIETKKINHQYSDVFNLISFIQNEDNNMSTIEKEFQKQPGLVANLLNYMCSSQFAFKREISSIKQAITLLGRETLVRWLFLFIYSNQEKKSSEVLTNNVMIRAHIMENLSEELNNEKSFRQMAYITGILSLIDILLEVDKEEFFNKITLNEKIKNAIIKKSGDLGRLLEITERMEQGDISFLEDFSKEKKIALDNLLKKIKITEV